MRFATDLAVAEPANSGSVFWIEELAASVEQLRKLAEGGLWSDSWNDAQRRAEGFNRFTLAAWP
jgi:CRISPR-associated protein Cmr3